MRLNFSTSVRLRLESPVKRSGDYLFLKFLFSRPRVRPNQCLPKLMAAYGGFFFYNPTFGLSLWRNICSMIAVRFAMRLHEDTCVYT